MVNIMTKIKVTLVLLALVTSFLPLVRPAQAQTQEIGFDRCTNNGSPNVESQFFIKIEDLGSGVIKFTLRNAGPVASSIEDLHIHDPNGRFTGSTVALIDADEGVGGDGGVDFSIGGGNGNLAGRNDCTPAFPGGTSANFRADADSPAPTNGINPGESLMITYNLAGGNTFTDVLADIISGDMRFGIHALSIDNSFSDTFVSEGLTAIELESFDVDANDGRAMVMWETGTETDNAGFNLYRAPTKDGPWFQINDSLIPADGSAVSGATYTFFDTPGRGRYYYRLEDINYSGRSTLHEPILGELGPTIRTPWFRPTLPTW
jgi:hypothetical protein